MKHVFISYQQEDGDFADALISRVEKAGFKTWVDSDKLHAGEDWRTEIDQAIKSAFALIVIMTPEAKASEYVTYEWAFAWGAGIKVIPVVLKPTQLHPRLAALHYLNFTNRTNRRWEDLLDVLKNAEATYKTLTNDTSQDIPSYIRQAIIALDSANTEDRKGAIETLAQANHPVAIQQLIGALQHPIASVRILAALELHNNSQAVPILLKALRNTNRDIRSKASEALKKIDDVGKLSLLDALHNPDENIRDAAAEVLGEIKHPAGISGLLDALHDSHENVRGTAAEALGKIGDPAAIPGLLEALHDKSIYMREFLFDNDDHVRLNMRTEYIASTAAEALGKIGDPASVPNLLEALHENDEFLRHKDTLSFLDMDQMMRDRLTKALQQIGTPEALAALKHDNTLS